jgi:hypothetical protein
VFEGLGFWALVSGSRLMISGLRFLDLGFWFLVSVLRFLA